MRNEVWYVQYVRLLYIPESPIAFVTPEAAFVIVVGVGNQLFHGVDGLVTGLTSVDLYL